MEGTPGTGKTTVALQFLLEGAKAGERCLYITLSETERELRESAASHGWVLGDGIEVFELLPPESLLDSDQQQSLLYSSDLELGETTRQIFAAVDRVRPSRVVLDSLSEIRLLAQSSLRYRRQILAIKHYFAKFNATVMLLDDLTADVADKTVHSLAHGVIRLEELAPDLRRGAPPAPHHQVSRRQIPRRLSRRHDRHRRIERVSAAGRRPNTATILCATILSSGVGALDPLLGGGIESGSSTLMLGPPAPASRWSRIVFLLAAVERGEKAAMFVFDEELGLLLYRDEGTRHRPRAVRRSRATSSSSRSTPPRCRPANSPTWSASASTRTISRPW